MGRAKNAQRIDTHTEYNGAEPNCSVDSLPVSFPLRNNETSSAVERFKQLPMFAMKMTRVRLFVLVSMRMFGECLVDECSTIKFTPKRML